MLAFLLAFAAQPLQSYADVPLLGLLGKHPAFFAPLVKQLESSRKLELPAVCPSGTRAAVVFDMAGYLTQLAGNPTQARRWTALGLSQAQALTVCFGGKRVTATLEATRLSGLLGSLTPSTLDLDHAAGDHYWIVRASLAWAATWDALNALDRAETGLRASRLDALLLAASAILEGDAFAALVTPLSGRMTFGETAAGKHFAGLEATDTTGYARLLRTLDTQVPHASFGRKAQPNEWGFNGGIAGFSGQGDVFVRLAPAEVQLADAASALDRARTYRSGAALDACVVGTFDLARYRKLFTRVGRPDDVRNFVRRHALQAWVDLKHAPAPAALVLGERVTYQVRKEGQHLALQAELP